MKYRIDIYEDDVKVGIVEMPEFGVRSRFNTYQQDAISSKAGQLGIIHYAFHLYKPKNLVDTSVRTVVE